ncbi:von Willebrand factor A domain-containing protein 7-like isoform 1-T2 [Menidia menidia]
MCGLAVLCLLLLQTGVHGFGVIFRSGRSRIHEDITKEAILNVTAQVCRSLALAEGKDFTFPPQPFTAKSIADACEAPKSKLSFLRAILLTQVSNAKTDFLRLFSPRYHFDDEQFEEGKTIIKDALEVVKANNRKENFFFARYSLGGLMHTLQDFYSHSNWVEMGNTLPNSDLIRPGRSIGKVADRTRATCSNCEDDVCKNNILEDILEERILTSGYFKLVSSNKTAGKCSHGNFPDATRKTEPKGGINKDKLSSVHGYLHGEAVRLAIAATSELLEDVRGAAGDRQFLQMMDINKGSSKALCFVIDTTGSMGDDIAAVRRVTASIIDSKVGTEDEPSSYILVTFNDPAFGPLQKTTDPKVFQNSINSLFPSGGGDAPEMSLSGLQLALTGAPPNSEIFVFTDAPAKDAHLRNTVIALIERTKSVVNFMITNVLGRRRRRQADNGQQQQSRMMSRSGAQLYRDLAQASGGQAIEVTKGQLLEATSIIQESSSPSLVTLLQVSRSPGRAENFPFTVDESVSNMKIYITGRSVGFTLIDPSGVPQNATGSSAVGNFQTLRLQTKVGVWEMRMASTNPYTLKVVGESPIDFLFDFMKESQGPLGGFDFLDNRPTAGTNGSLMVTLSESDSATVTEVTLVESSGSGVVNGSVEARGEGQFFVQFDRIPSVEFVVLVKGQNNTASRASSGIFQRQSTTSIRASSVTVTADDSDTVLEPGKPRLVAFSVMTNGPGGTFTIQAGTDQGFDLTSPSSLSLEAGGSANGTVSLTAPLDTVSGTGVTLTIEAVAPGGSDTNYAVLRLTVLPTVTDVTEPSCQLISLQSNCSDNCSQSMWELSVQVTDGAEGSGVDRISLREGSGTLNTSMAAGSQNGTLVSYAASCCSPDVQLVVVDGVGNVATCRFSIRANVTPEETTMSPLDPTTANVTAEETTMSTLVPTTASVTNVTSLSVRGVQSVFLCLGITVLGLGLSSEMH